MAGKGGGAWKVAYADFVTAMMAFFMVMWITAQNKPVKEAIAHYFEDPSGFSDPSEGLPSGNTESTGSGPRSGVHRRGPKQRGRGSKDPGPMPLMTADPDDSEVRRPSLFMVHDGDRSSVGTVVPFNPDSATLDDVSRQRLDEVAPLLLGKPNKIEIRGHATRQAAATTGEVDESWKLSYDRCMAVFSYLRAKGVEVARMRLSQAGPYEPYTLRFDPQGQSRNSRVEVFMVSEFANELNGTRDERANRYSAPSTGH